MYIIKNKTALWTFKKIKFPFPSFFNVHAMSRLSFAKSLGYFIMYVILCRVTPIVSKHSTWVLWTNIEICFLVTLLLKMVKICIKILVYFHCLNPSFILFYAWKNQNIYQFLLNLDRLLDSKLQLDDFLHGVIWLLNRKKTLNLLQDTL